VIFHPPEMTTPFLLYSFSQSLQGTLSPSLATTIRTLFVHFRSFPAHPSRNQTCAS
jgi:hypothetical protein